MTCVNFSGSVPLGGGGGGGAVLAVEASGGGVARGFMGGDG